MDDKKCIFCGDCPYTHMDCEETNSFFKCPDRATESPAPSGQAELVGYSVEELRKIAKIVGAAYEKTSNMIDAMHFVTDIYPDARSEVIRGMWLAIDEL